MNNFARLKRESMKKAFIWAGVVVVLFLAIFIWWKYYFTYSEGYRSGILQKFSYKGNIVKTYEGEMILSSIESKKDVPLASEKFFFSVTDEKIAKHLEQIQGQMITVHYTQKHGTLLWRGESAYFVDSVRTVQQEIAN
jgi:hypothetical protein